jgi:hypothetical protein
MNYEQKYLKYKIKYLKLVSKQQTGGGLVAWPEQMSDIKLGDKLKVIDAMLQDDVPENHMDAINRVISEKKYLTVGKVDNDVLILQHDNGEDTNFNIDIFKTVVLDRLYNRIRDWPEDVNKIIVGDIVQVKNTILQRDRFFSENSQVNVYVGETYWEVVEVSEDTLKLKKKDSGLYNGEQQSFGKNDFKKVVLDVQRNNQNENPIEKQIKLLQERLDSLEKNFKNHYHDIPTSGVKEFEEQHPYYKRAN